MEFICPCCGKNRVEILKKTPIYMNACDVPSKERVFVEFLCLDCGVISKVDKGLYRKYMEQL